MASPISCLSILIIPLLVTSLFYDVSNTDQALIESCKVVIYNYMFCSLLFHAKFDCNYIQSVVTCMYCGISL